MIPIVLDTSSVVKILASPKRSVILAKLLQDHRIFTSDYILSEIEYVLVRKFGKSKQKSRTITNTFAKLCTVVEPNKTKHTIRDASDSPIVDLCVATKATLLVTNDKDLLGITLPKCKALTYEIFLKTI